MLITSTHWGVIVIGANVHREVGSALKQREVEHFIPLEEREFISGGRRMARRYPILGRYVPIAINSEWRGVTSIRGVEGIMLNDAGWPAQIVPGEMQRLRELCDDDGVFRPPAPIVGGFVYGQQVTPRDGPLAYHIGTFDGRAGRRCEAALFTLFGREQRIVFKQGELIAADGSIVVRPEKRKRHHRSRRHRVAPPVVA